MESASARVSTQDELTDSDVGPVDALLTRFLLNSHSLERGRGGERERVVVGCWGKLEITVIFLFISCFKKKSLPLRPGNQSRWTDLAVGIGYNMG